MLKRFFQMSDALGELLCGILFFGVICQIGLIIFLRLRAKKLGTTPLYCDYGKKTGSKDAEA